MHPAPVFLQKEQELEGPRAIIIAAAKGWGGGVAQLRRAASVPSQPGLQ